MATTPDGLGRSNGRIGGENGGAMNGKALAYAARPKWATVSVETEAGTYVGRLYIPYGKKRASDVLNDDRPFINLSEVTMAESTASEPFLAISKTYIRTVRILDEGEADVVPISQW